MLCGDQSADKAVAASLIESIHGLRAVDCGPLDLSGVCERITALLVGVNRRYKTHAGIRLTGLPVASTDASLGRPA